MIGEDFYRVYFPEREIGEFDVEAMGIRPAQVIAMSLRPFDELAQGTTSD
jgi:hypothetical protein